jgi:transposase InsO family protein
VLRVVDDGWSPARAAGAAGVSENTCRKWISRYLAEGREGLVDRSSAPHSVPHRTSEELVEVIALLRRLRMTGAEIAFCLAMALSTVSAVLLRIGLGKLSRLEPPEPPNRYERRHPGELVHIDVKKLGRIRGAGHRVTGSRASQKRTRVNGRRTGVAGWEFVHVCVDDATRLAYVEVLGDETATTAVGFLHRAIRFYRRHGITVERVMTDNGSAYVSHAFRKAIQDAGLKHKRTRPYTPKTNGKAERFIQTSLREWAYLQAFASSAARTQAMRPWLHAYNTQRPHSALAGKPPFARLSRDNLHSNDT